MQAIDLAHVRRRLEDLVTLRRFRPLSPQEAAEYAELCRLERALLEAASPAWR